MDWGFSLPHLPNLFMVVYLLLFLSGYNNLLLDIKVFSFARLDLYCSYEISFWSVVLAFSFLLFIYFWLLWIGRNFEEVEFRITSYFSFVLFILFLIWLPIEFNVNLLQLVLHYWFCCWFLGNRVPEIKNYFPSSFFFPSVCKAFIFLIISV